MKIVKTIISSDSIEMRLADDEDPATAKQWIHFQVPRAAVRAITKSSMEPYALEPIESRTLAVIREAALRYVQAAVDEEIGRA